MQFAGLMSDGIPGMSRPPAVRRKPLCQDNYSCTLELPDEVAGQLPDKELAAKAKEALVMELLEEHQVSQGKAAEILGISRYKSFRFDEQIFNSRRRPYRQKSSKSELKLPFPRS